MERNTPVRKQHTNTTDLLAWPENTPGPSSHPTTASRSHQFSGQVTDEEFVSLNKRKPCSGSGIFTGNGENEESDPSNANPTPNSKTGIRMYQPAGGQVSGEEEQTQAPSPPPAAPASSEVSAEEEQTQAPSPPPVAKPQSQPVSGSEEEEQQPQPVAPPPTQVTTSKKRKSSEAENGGVGGSVAEKSEDEEDLPLAQLSFYVDKEYCLLKQRRKLLDGEKRAKTEKAWKKLQVDVEKFKAKVLAVVEEQFMDCCLSNHSLSCLEEEEEEDCLSDDSLSSLEEEEEEEEEEEYMQQTEASINPAKEQVQMEEEDGKKEKSE